jgi:glycosyltransferase involved in cell wall biosynthesis
MPLVSFCLSTYKRGSILKDTLDSIKRQDFQDYEVVVSDNDVDESGRSYVEAMADSRFKYFSNGENLGMKPSFNKSFERSSGEFIVMMADDDPVYHDMLTTLVKLRKQHPGYGIYMGGCDWFCTAPEVAKLYQLKVGTNSCLSSNHDHGHIATFDPLLFVIQLVEFGFFPHYLWSTCMVESNIIRQMGGIPHYGTPFLGDYAYLSVMGSAKGCVMINKALGCQALHKENFGRDQNDQLVTVATNFPAYLKEKMPHLWNDLEPRIVKFVGLWLVTHMSFLYHYAVESRNNLKKAEKQVFEIPFMKSYKMKYYLKTRFPKTHDQLVRLKKKF